MRRSHQPPSGQPSPPPPPVGNLLSLKQVAERLGVHYTTLYRYRAQGLPVIYVSRRNVKVDEHDLNQWLAARKDSL
ncbi:MAG: helix-turn-helix domain-containing protein [Thermogemmatispora sp.]|uniref:helix-turn-helix transcriptional regulator n=1 Tax=Thermogemmatispora TaxID=768669 RepID=UPI000DDC12C2|nr:helix-turn-helix domain-containing protein [Thermogemmatispora sp.]MBX5456605.1 helix-turn-helix domain-containing protein [Thermogemmatispora sp.]